MKFAQSLSMVGVTLRTNLQSSRSFLWLRPGLEEAAWYLQTYKKRCILLVALIVSTISAAQLFIHLKLQKASIEAAELVANRTSAREFAFHLLDVTKNLDESKLLQRLHELSSLNRSVRLYLIDQYGIILQNPYDEINPVLPFVDLRPVKHYLQDMAESDGKGTQVIYGDDPSSMRRVPISVTPLRVNEKEGYLYVAISPWSSSGIVERLAQGGILKLSIAAIAITLLILLLVGASAVIFFSLRLNAMNMALATLSHDLRTPLAAIQGYVETLLMHDPQMPPVERRRFLSIVLRSTKTLIADVNDLLELARLDSVNFRERFEPVDIADLVFDSVSYLTEEGKARQVLITVAVPEFLPMVLGDVGLLGRLITNILTNSIRYNRPGGSVSVQVSTVGKSVAIEISDTGRGLSKADLCRITRPYFRSERDPLLGKRSSNEQTYQSSNESGGSSKVAGTGLGLALAKKIVKIHGGKLKIKSQLEVGTKVEFDLALV